VRGGTALEDNHHLLLAKVDIRARTLTGLAPIPVEVIRTLSRRLLLRTLGTRHRMLILPHCDA
jgi:hypothetical protein